MRESTVRAAQSVVMTLLTFPITLGMFLMSNDFTAYAFTAVTGLCCAGIAFAYSHLADEARRAGR